MSGLTRQEMKRDEVREWMEVAMEWMIDNVRLILGVVGAIAGIVLLAVIVLSMLRGRAERSQEALGDALRTYSASIDAVSPDPENATSPSFASEADRRSAAQAAFESVQQNHGGSDAARIAEVYLGTLAAQSGDLAAARSRWESALPSLSDTALTASVRMNLLSLDRQEGKHAEIVESLEAELESSSSVLPADLILYELARSLEATGAAETAKERFQQLIDEHPGSQYAVQARNRVANLG